MGGLFKIYPFVLLALSVRERPRAFVVIAPLSIVAILAFGGYYWSDFQEVVARLPAFVFWGDTFTAKQLPFGIANYFRLSIDLGVFLMLLLFVTVRLQRPAASSVLLQSIVSRSDWERPEFFLLATGCLVMGACFVAGANVGYRSIMLLFVLPGLLDLKFGVLSHGLKLILDGNVEDGSVPPLEGVLPASCRCCVRWVRPGRLAASGLFRFPRAGLVVGLRSFHGFCRAFLVAIPISSGAQGWGGAESLPPKPNDNRFGAVTQLEPLRQSARPEARGLTEN